MAEGQDKAARSLLDLESSAIIDLFIIYPDIINEPSTYVPVHNGTVFRKGVVWQDNHNLMYLGMQDQFHTFNMFDCQAWFVRDVIMGKIKMPTNEDIDNDIKKWVSEEETLEDPNQMIDFQTEYTKDLHSSSDYPAIDFELIRKHFKVWEHHKEEDIMTYRNNSFSSAVTGTVATIHHTSWAEAMDDSMETFMKSK